MHFVLGVLYGKNITRGSPKNELKHLSKGRQRIRNTANDMDVYDGGENVTSGGSNHRFPLALIKKF